MDDAAQPTGTGIRDDKRTLYAVELIGPIEQVEETEGKPAIRKLLRSSKIIFTDGAKATAVARLFGRATSLCRVEEAQVRRAEAGAVEKSLPDSMAPSAAETTAWLAEKVTTWGGYVVESDQGLLGLMTQKVSYSDFRQQGATLTVTETERLKFSRDGKESVTTRKVVIDLKNVRCSGEAEKAPVSFAPVGKYFAAVVEAGARGRSPRTWRRMASQPRSGGPSGRCSSSRIRRWPGGSPRLSSTSSPCNAPRPSHFDGSAPSGELTVDMLLEDRPHSGGACSASVPSISIAYHRCNGPSEGCVMLHVHETRSPAITGRRAALAQREACFRNGGEIR